MLRGGSTSFVLACALGGLLVVPASSAEVERVEVVGAAPARDKAPKGISPRQAALRAGVADAALQAGMRMTEEAGATVEPAALRSALGDDPFSYAVRFRLLEDRGERRRLLLEDPDVEWEYVVLIEVQLDLDRLRERLAQAGLLGTQEPGGPVQSLRVAVEGFISYGAYQTLRERLAPEAGAVHPLEFARGHVLLELETDRSSQEILDRLRSDLPPELSVLPIEVEEGELRIRAVQRSPIRKSRPLFGGGELGPGTGSERPAAARERSSPD